MRHYDRHCDNTLPLLIIPCATRFVVISPKRHLDWGKKVPSEKKRVCECETTFVIISNEITCPSSLEIVKFTIIPSNRTERLAGQSSNRNITINACNKFCAKQPGIQKAATIQQKNNQVHHPAPWLPFPLPVTSSPTWPHFDRTSKTSSTIIISRQHCQKTKIPRAVLSGKTQSKSAQDLKRLTGSGLALL